MKIDESILDKDPAWMRSASIDDLRDFLRFIEELPDSPKVKNLLAAFDAECSRRAQSDYENRNGGEWI